MMSNYIIRPEATAGGFLIVELTTGEFGGISYAYSKVIVEEDKTNGNGILRFDYSIVTGEISDEKKSRFETYIGDILMEEMQKQIDKSEVVYSGGK
jgi:hypothetical protein